MIDYQNFKLIHLHGDERFPMTEAAPLDAADLDPERAWARGERVFRCSGCDGAILVVPDRPKEEPESA
jgi:hypothetical protein